MGISKMLDISKTHITAETSDWLDKEVDLAEEITAYAKEGYGWFIVITPDDLDNDNIPEDLMRCMKLAYKKKCHWLCIDQDGEVLDDLPVFEA